MALVLWEFMLRSTVVSFSLRTVTCLLAIVMPGSSITMLSAKSWSSRVVSVLTPVTRGVVMTLKPVRAEQVRWWWWWLTLTWHIVLRLQGHVTVKKESRIVDALVDCTSRDSCMSERKARSSVYHEKLAVMTKPERTLADCSKQMRQLPGRHGRRW